eukprot:823960-Lingulodinium_polyedra.AAC.1
MAGAKCSTARDNWSSTAVWGALWPPNGCPEEQDASGPGRGPPWTAWCSAVSCTTFCFAAARACSAN